MQVLLTINLVISVSLSVDFASSMRQVESVGLLRIFSTELLELTGSIQAPAGQ